MANIKMIDAAGKKLVIVFQRMPNNVIREYVGIGAPGMARIIADIERDKEEAKKAFASVTAFERGQEMAAWRA